MDDYVNTPCSQELHFHCSLCADSGLVDYIGYGSWQDEYERSFAKGIEGKQSWRILRHYQIVCSQIPTTETAYCAHVTKHYVTKA